MAEVHGEDFGVSAKNDSLDELLISQENKRLESVKRLYSASKALLYHQSEVGKGYIDKYGTYIASINIGENLFRLEYKRNDTLSFLRVYMSRKGIFDYLPSRGVLHLGINNLSNKGFEIYTYVPGDWEGLLENEAGKYILEAVSAEARKQVANQKSSV